jgi:hypothetical protein
LGEDKALSNDMLNIIISSNNKNWDAPDEEMMEMRRQITVY